jgi:hypothetical protein
LVRIRDARSATGPNRKNPHFLPKNRENARIFITGAHHRPIK